MSNCQSDSVEEITLSISNTNGKCTVGEKVGDQGIKNNSIPVLSCEGACIRGEIARLAANYVSKHENYKRGCHGELFTVPNSKIAQWIKSAQKVICIDGCFLRCHSRILEKLIEPSMLLVFDALSHYKRFNEIFDIDEVPEAERKKVGKSVAQWVINSIEENKIPGITSSTCKYY